MACDMMISNGKELFGAVPRRSLVRSLLANILLQEWRDFLG
jgi:hypothetical protein